MAKLKILRELDYFSAKAKKRVHEYLTPTKKDRKKTVGELMIHSLFPAHFIC